MPIYLDTCCFNRPFDDQSIDRNRFEAEAVLTILRGVHRGDWELVGSEANDLETGLLNDLEKREIVEGLMRLQGPQVSVTDSVKARSIELIGIGFAPLDALHVACAETGKCSALLTTDDAMIRTGARNAGRLRTRVVNPLDWLREQIGYERNDA